MQCFTMNDSDEWEKLELTGSGPWPIMWKLYYLGIKAVDAKVINTSVALIHITTTKASLLPLFEKKRMPIV